MKKYTPWIAASLLVSFGFSIPADAKSLVNSGGTCSSQGAWTSRALEQSKLILTTAEQLKNDPDCKALSEAITKIDAKALYDSLQDNGGDGPGAKYETLPADLLALRTVLMQNPNNIGLNARLSPLLASSTIDLAVNNASLLGPLGAKELEGVRTRIKRTRGMGEALLSAVFTALPQNSKCLQKSKNLDSGLTILTGAIRMMAAFSSSNEGSGQNLAVLMSQFNNFIREMKYNNIINELNIAQFWTEMSCLIETTQQSYCGAKDALQLLDYQAKEAQVLAELRENLSKGKVSKDSAIEGYLLLSREVANVTQWLTKVQAGIEAKTENDANFKNDIWGTVTGLIQNINLLQGRYNENLVIYRGLTSLEGKQQNLRVLIRTLSRTTSTQGGKVNFFTQAIQDDLVPFYLIGRNQIPNEVLGTTGMAMDPYKYLQDPAKVPELGNPDALMATILERLSSLSDLALREGSKYFAQNMTVDHLNLVDDTFTGSVSVYDSIKSIRVYITRLAAKYAKSKGDGQRLTLSMADTVARLDRVLKKFDALEATAKEYNLKLNDGTLKLGDIGSLSREDQDKVRAQHKELITTVYDELNLLLQKDAFIGQRLSTYVRFDLNQRMRTKEDMSPYVQYLLIASGKNLMNRMQELQSFNAAESEADLSEAQRINRVNLDQMEELFAGDVWTYINKLSQETGKPYVRRYTDNPFRPMYKIITDFHNVTWQQISHLPGYTGQGNNQDEDGALAFLRAKMCTQTLGFKSWLNFQQICEGAVLQSRMTSNTPRDLRLKFGYKDLVTEKNMGVWDKLSVQMGGSYPEGKRYQHVCALRDFYRNNQVYWLTLQFNPAENDIPAGKDVPNPFD